MRRRRFPLSPSTSRERPKRSRAARRRRSPLATLQEDVAPLLRKAVLLNDEDAHALDRWAARLRRDSRSGAKALGRRCAAFARAFRVERARVAGLFERRAALHSEGVRFIAGVDEVGVGPLAGPVVAAAVVLRDDVDLPGLDDSKKLSAEQRERLDVAIRAQALAVGVGVVAPTEIDRLNIFRASLEAMRRAVEALPRTPGHLLVDARTVPGVSVSQTPLVHGDANDGSIAAASIVAKVYRDALMCRLDARHPGYGFARHMGYGTPEHLAALQRLGPSPLHRRSFAPVRAAARASLATPAATPSAATPSAATPFATRGG